MIKRNLVIGLIVSISVWFSAFASAHTMWINATDFSPENHSSAGHGAGTIIYFGWGHHYPADGFLTDEFLGEFYSMAPDGSKEKLTPNSGGFRATELKLKDEGGWIACAALKPNFYTMYVDKGKMHHEIRPKTGLKGVILSLYYEQYAKALINVGEDKDNSFSKSVGHKFEIIPLENPYRLHGCGGHFLPVKVLFDGKPAGYCQVSATYSGFSTGEDFAYLTSTDGEGIAKIRLTHWGPWLVKAEMKLPAQGEFKDKCNELHYTATMTFEIP